MVGEGFRGEEGAVGLECLSATGRPCSTTARGKHIPVFSLDRMWLTYHAFPNCMGIVCLLLGVGQTWCGLPDTEPVWGSEGLSLVLRILLCLPQVLTPVLNKILLYWHPLFV